MVNLLTTKETAAYLKLHECTVKKYYRSGQLKGLRLGNRLRFSTVDVDAFMQQQYPKEDKVCCTEEKIQSAGGSRLHLESMTRIAKQYKKALGLKIRD